MAVALMYRGASLEADKPVAGKGVAGQRAQSRPRPAAVNLPRRSASDEVLPVAWAIAPGSVEIRDELARKCHG
jgi:hypothetical protein